MPGMPSGASTALATAFRSALLAEGTLAFLIFVLLAIGWVICREALLARAGSWLAEQRALRLAEPAWRRVLRVGFGVLWIVDGLLQTQPAMPAGLPSQVILPTAAGSPGWVTHLVRWGAATWSGHPVDAAAGAVWIQLGIGIWLVSVSSPRWSRLAGLASMLWALIVWVFGESLGGMLAPGLSWLTGAPGAALFYGVAGGLLALPARYWHDQRLGQRMLQAAGLLMAGFALLQAWPGRGSWRGTLAGPGGSRLPGDLTSDISAMATARQPSVLHHLLTRFGALVAGHGFAVNLVAVVVLAATAGCLLSGRPAIARPAAGAAIGFCLADWVLVQDLGVFGGLGTDPNSMVPQAVILAAGLLAMSERPAPAPDLALGSAPAAGRSTGADAAPDQDRPRARLRPASAARRLGVAFGAASASAVLTLWAVAMVAMGAAPMALAAVHRTAAPALATAPLAPPAARSAVP